MNLLEMALVRLSLAGLACVGHLVIMVGSHNMFYGFHLPKRSSDFVHLFHALAVLALPVGLVVAFGPTLAGLADWEHACVYQRLLLGYLGFCLVAGCVWLPGLTLYRNLRGDPGKVTRREVVHVSTLLGRHPVGRGEHYWMGWLPGNELFQIEYIEKTLYLPRLPPTLQGVTVLHLSDLHLHGTPDRDYYRVLFDRCAAWQPDLVAITGDVVDSAMHYRWIVPLLGRLRWKVAALAILGNHDHYQDVTLIRRRLRRLGMKVPENSWLSVEVHGEPLIVIGHEGPWLGPEPNLDGCPQGPFRLCLSHTPDNIPWARRNGIDLMLAGHVHGGQVRVWPFGSLLVPSGYGRRYDMGTFELPPTLLHVSRGISGEQPLRYGCRPEVTLLTLQRAPRQDS